MVLCNFLSLPILSKKRLLDARGVAASLYEKYTKVSYLYTQLYEIDLSLKLVKIYILNINYYSKLMDSLTIYEKNDV